MPSTRQAIQTSFLQYILLPKSKDKLASPIPQFHIPNLTGLPVEAYFNIGNRKLFCTGPKYSIIGEQAKPRGDSGSPTSSVHYLRHQPNSRIGLELNNCISFCYRQLFVMGATAKWISIIAGFMSSCCTQEFLKLLCHVQLKLACDIYTGCQVQGVDTNT